MFSVRDDVACVWTFPFRFSGGEIEHASEQTRKLKWERVGRKEIQRTPYSLTRSHFRSLRVLLQVADLTRERERQLTTAHAEQILKYGQIRIESRLFRAPSSRHLTFPSCC